MSRPIWGGEMDSRRTFVSLTLTLSILWPAVVAANCTQPAGINECSAGLGRGLSECTVEWKLSPVPASNARGKVKSSLTCVEGDPACDVDPDGQNQSCTFRFSACINNEDPRLPQCVPSAVASVEVLKPSLTASSDAVDQSNAAAIEASFGPSGLGVTVLRAGVVHAAGVANGTPNACSESIDVQVPLKSAQVISARPVRSGKRSFKVRVVDDEGDEDVDTIHLTCVPNRCGNLSLEAYENCDDGNRIDGDGCSSVCRIEPTPTPSPTPLPQPSPTPEFGEIRLQGGTFAGAGSRVDVQTAGILRTRITLAGKCSSGGDCLADADCPVGSYCSLPKVNLLVGEPDPVTQQATITIPQASVHFNPARSTVNTLCVSAAGDGTGQIDCDGGATGLDVALERDHDTTPSGAFNCGGFPDDPECDDTCTFPDGGLSRACMEGTYYCAGGPSEGMSCSGHGDCPDSFCASCNIDAPHAGACHSPACVQTSGTFGAGDLQVTLPLRIRYVRTDGLGDDGIPCTEDDPVTGAESLVRVVLTTGTASATAHDTRVCVSGGITGSACFLPTDSCFDGECACHEIASTAFCPPSGTSPCLASVSGQEVSCADLIAGQASGLVLSGTAVGFDLAGFADAVLTFKLVAK